LWSDSEGERASRTSSRAARHLGGVRELGMCGHSLRGNRDTSNEVCVETWQTLQGRLIAVRLWIGSDEESDGNIVPRKSANKGMRVPAELMEGRAPAKRNSEQDAANRIQGREIRVDRNATSASRDAILKVGAVCSSSARTDLCGGHPATGVPTATGVFRKARRRGISPERVQQVVDENRRVLAVCPLIDQKSTCRNLRISGDSVRQMVRSRVNTSVGEIAN
jgi:hypothetical protein